MARKMLKVEILIPGAFKAGGGLLLIKRPGIYEYNEAIASEIGAQQGARLIAVPNTAKVFSSKKGDK